MLFHNTVYLRYKQSFQKQRKTSNNIQEPRRLEARSLGSGQMGGVRSQPVQKTNKKSIKEMSKITNKHKI